MVKKGGRALVTNPHTGRKEFQTRKINHTVASGLLAFAFHEFVQKLRDAVELTNGATQLIETCEAYTSRHCGYCDWSYGDELGGRKTFVCGNSRDKCDAAGIPLDRDSHASVNIFALCMEVEQQQPRRPP